ncbi:MAG: hypothetical protein A2736_02875 [Candidatus Yanofskybacteria bacterium RIFCSPHIGHO2_01_FULL_41_27]|uniref:Uncharacterized protein n=2 Tax=Parcubacteria group TaxID=1794811 RepID=A0A0G0XKS4_9BACT|nr:MAG: hypothetical protein UU83_C0005G0013 [Candidatus Jorgensenbacteria bacterium GW2011_GWF2_41_8]OGM99775.1 MAG: hypothetical protein A2736_02875 [Candidatus Yanofskybacteria bacterium RIFCSPHIGHO2_01_FULL_41_27]
MILKFTQLLIRTIWVGADWVTEAFVSYCEALIRAGIRAGLAVLVADILVRASIQFDSNMLLLFGILIGSGGLFYFAVISAPARIMAEGLSQLSAIAKQEIERLSNILFLIMVMLFYLGIDQGQQHPTLLRIFLGIMMLLFFAVILPGQSKTIMFFKKRFQTLVLIPVVLMTIFAATPEAIANRIFNGHILEKTTGTVAVELSYRYTEQDLIIDNSTGRPMVFFDQIAAKNSEQPRPLIGWTQDQQKQYHLYKWFDGQKNFNGFGQEIKPITTDKLNEVVKQAKFEFEKKIADKQKLADAQKAAAVSEPRPWRAAEAEALQRKAEEESSALLQQQENKIEAENAYNVETDNRLSEIEQPQNENEIIPPNPPSENLNEQEEITSPVVPLIPVNTVIMAPNNKFSGKDLIIARPNEKFVYQDKAFYPYRSIITLKITEVKPTLEKNKYLVTAQPQSLIVDSFVNKQTYDISSQTEPIQFTAEKDDSHSWQKILGGAAIGAGIGALADGKKGAAKGALIGGGAGTVYAIASHGYKFKLTPGDSLTIMFRP